MANIRVEDNRLVYGGVAYFRGGSEGVDLTTIGEKHNPIGKMPYLEVKDRLPVQKLGTATSVPVEIDFQSTRKSAFSGLITAIVSGVPVKLHGEETFEKLQSGQLSLTKLSVTTKQMKDAINGSPERLKSLADWGQNARCVLSMFVIVDGEISTQIHRSGSVDLSIGKAGLEAVASNTSSADRGTHVRFATGTPFAYLLGKVEWGKKKEHVDDVTDDQQGLA